MDLLTRLDDQRLELEANTVKLRKALNHWRGLELDYEGLKDEIDDLSEDATKSDYLDVVQDFAPQNMSFEELNKFFEPKKDLVRKPKQIVDILSKRLDYVRENVKTLKSQIERHEKQVESMLSSDPGLDEVELPVTEIIEELDEDGNVLSSKIQPQGHSASKLIDILERVEGDTEEQASTSNKHKTFTDPAEIQTNSQSRNPNLVAGAEKSRDNVLNPHSLANDNDSDVVSVNREDTEEEAQLRREMLQYGLEEVGKIVAELELDPATESEDPDNLSDNLEDSDISDLDEYSDEDEEDSGRTHRSAYPTAYRKRMEDLQERLGIRMENVGPSSSSSELSEHIEIPSATEAQQYIDQLPPVMRKRVEPPSAKEAARDAAIAREEASKSVNDRKKSRTSKKVSFASKLDIAADSPKKEVVPVTSEEVVERNASTTTTNPETTNSTRPSPFKSSHNSRDPKPSILKATQPTAEEHDAQAESQGFIRTHSNVLIERPISAKLPSAPETDDFDEELQRRQIALEHHKLKNRLVHKQGGYVQGGELDNWGDEVVAPEFVDERTGQSKKISRFKAARLKG